MEYNYILEFGIDLTYDIYDEYGDNSYTDADDLRDELADAEAQFYKKLVKNLSRLNFIEVDGADDSCIYFTTNHPITEVERDTIIAAAEKAHVLVEDKVELEFNTTRPWDWEPDFEYKKYNYMIEMYVVEGTSEITLLGDNQDDVSESLTEINSVNRKGLQESYSALEIKKNQLLANGWTEEEINDLPNTLYDRYYVDVDILPDKIRITDRHHGENMAYFKHYSGLGRFAIEVDGADESLNEVANDYTTDANKLKARLREINKAIERGEDPEYFAYEKKKIFDQLDSLGSNYYDESLTDQSGRRNLREATKELSDEELCDAVAKVAKEIVKGVRTGTGKPWCNLDRLLKALDEQGIYADWSDIDYVMQYWDCGLDSTDVKGVQIFFPHGFGDKLDIEYISKELGLDESLNESADSSEFGGELTYISDEELLSKFDTLYTKYENELNSKLNITLEGEPFGRYSRAWKTATIPVDDKRTIKVSLTYSLPDGIYNYIYIMWTAELTTKSGAGNLYGINYSSSSRTEEIGSGSYGAYKDGSREKEEGMTIDELVSTIKSRHLKESLLERYGGSYYVQDEDDDMVKSFGSEKAAINYAKKLAKKDGCEYSVVFWDDDDSTFIGKYGPKDESLNEAKFSNATANDDVRLVKSSYDHFMNDLGEIPSPDDILYDIIDNYNQDIFQDGGPYLEGKEIEAIKYILRSQGLEYRGEFEDSLNEASVKSFVERDVLNKIRKYEMHNLSDGIDAVYVDSARRVDKVGTSSGEEPHDIIKATVAYVTNDNEECVNKMYKVYDSGEVKEISDKGSKRR